MRSFTFLNTASLAALRRSISLIVVGLFPSCAGVHSYSVRAAGRDQPTG